MTQKEFEYFNDFRNRFRNKVSEWHLKAPELKDLQKQAAESFNTPSYPFETPIVYNKALDSVCESDDIKIIIVGDNPGKDEQLLKNNKYLVGQAGKLGERFFRMNPELNIDFRKSTIILNKTPVHTAKTNQLKYLLKNGSNSVRHVIVQSEYWMATETALLAKQLNAQIWLVGYSELKPNGIFTRYREELKEKADISNVLVFQHFSMNRFTIDLNEFRAENPTLNLKDALYSLGTKHRNEIFFGHL